MRAAVYSIEMTDCQSCNGMGEQLQLAESGHRPVDTNSHNAPIGAVLPVHYFNITKTSLGMSFLHVRLAHCTNMFAQPTMYRVSMLAHMPAL